MRRIITRWASRLISRQRKDPRDKIRAKARQICRDMGREIPEPLR